MRNLERIIDAIRAEPWLITPQGLEQILAIVEQGGDMDALAMKRSQKLDLASRAGIRNGVATINFIGPVMRYGNVFSEISGASSLQMTAHDFQIAQDDPSVNAIMLNIDSPGGQAAGIAEFSATIRASKKPVWAYVDDLGASAGYWIASAAHKVILSRTAMVGSIGVVSTYRKRKDDKVEETEIVSSQSPKKRMDVTSDEGRAEVQRIVDQLASVFVSDVAAYRDVPEEKVIADFGAGSIVFASDAVAAGMADDIGTYEGAIAELAGSASNPAQRRHFMSTKSSSEVKVSNTEDLRTALEAGYTAEQIIIEHPNMDQALADAKAEGVKEGQSASTQDAVTAERKRIEAIHGMARVGFEAETNAALEDGSSPEAFAMALLNAAKERGITLDAILDDSPPAASHAKPGDDSGKPSTINRAAIFESRRKKTA